MVWTVTLPYACERLFSPGSQLSKGILWLEDGKQMGSQLLPAPLVLWLGSVEEFR